MGFSPVAPLWQGRYFSMSLHISLAWEGNHKLILLILERRQYWKPGYAISSSHKDSVPFLCLRGKLHTEIFHLEAEFPFFSLLR